MFNRQMGWERSPEGRKAFTLGKNKAAHGFSFEVFSSVFGGVVANKVAGVVARSYTLAKYSNSNRLVKYGLDMANNLHQNLPKAFTPIRVGGKIL